MPFDPVNNNADAIKYLQAHLRSDNVRLTARVLDGLRARLKNPVAVEDSQALTALRDQVRTLQGEKEAMEIASLGLQDEVEALKAKLSEKPATPRRRTRKKTTLSE